MASEGLTRALELDPNLAIAHSRLAWVQEMAHWDFAAADRSRESALELAPNDPIVLTNSAALSIALGRPDEAAELYNRALRLEEAESAMQRGLELTPDYSLVHYRLGEIYLAQGRASDALAEFEQESIEWKSLQGQALAQHALGNSQESDAALSELTEDLGDDAAWELAQVHAFRGEIDLAFAWLDKAYELHDTGLRDVKVDPLLRNLHSDPRWSRFLKRMGLAD
jgi:tetratricopeptide (TPR) repeat protein